MSVAGLPGSGPWAISIYCTAPFHNTTSACQGRHGRPPCICPRALDLLADQRRRRKEAYDRAPVGRPRGKGELSTRFLYAVPNVPKGPMPGDLREGACRTPDGQKVADAGMNRHSTSAGIRDRERAKALCNTLCTVRDVCRAYVLGNESPQGSWGGVWGGLDPWNRRGQEIYVESGKAKVRPIVD